MQRRSAAAVLRSCAAAVILAPLAAGAAPPPAVAIESALHELARGPELWPGFDPLAIPLAVFDGERTWLFRHPAPPPGFAAAAGAAAAVGAGRHEAVVANSSAEIGGLGTATLRADLAGPEATARSLAGVAIHEAFHVFQRREHPGWQANEVDLFVYPFGEESLLALRRLEDLALGRALAAADPGESACHARRALAVRGERFAALGAAGAGYERGTELNEGLASDVQRRALGESATAELGGFAADDVRRRAYRTGAALAALLDRHATGWRQRLRAGRAEHLDGELARALGSAGGCAGGDPERRAAERAAAADLEELRARRDRLRAAFAALPGERLEIVADAAPLWPQGFDPLNVTRLDAVTVLHGRLLSLGNEAGSLELVDGQALSVGAGPHPLFDGVVRLEIAGLAGLEIAEDGEAVRLAARQLAGTLRGARVERRPDRVLLHLAPAGR